MKHCKRCQTDKEDSEYRKSSRSKDGLQSWCRACMVSYDQERWRNNKTYIYGVKKTRYQKLRLEYVDYKKTLICTVCGEDAVECLEFHHIDPTQKDQAVSNVAGSWSRERLERELEKCYVLCANCHRKVHSGRISVGPES